MIKWIVEDYEFQITVISLAPDNDPKRCRMGFEVGDVFTCKYECPAGFCPKSMGKLHALCDVVRAEGDLRLLGGDAVRSIRFTCADGPVLFRLEGNKIG